MTMREQLLTVAKAYSEARGLSMSRVSTLVFNDGKKLSLVENGSDLHTAKFEQVMNWFFENWPSDIDWPSEVPFPRSEQASEVA